MLHKGLLGVGSQSKYCLRTQADTRFTRLQMSENTIKFPCSIYVKNIVVLMLFDVLLLLVGIIENVYLLYGHISLKKKKDRISLFLLQAVLL